MNKQDREIFNMFPCVVAYPQNSAKSVLNSTPNQQHHFDPVHLFNSQLHFELKHIWALEN
jgi:hypothetical protein